MTDLQTDLDARSQFALGLSILVPAISAQGLVIANNIPWVGQYFGWAMIMTYVAATIVMLAMPQIKKVIGSSRHLRITNVAIVLFISWITVEENLHAAHAWAAPEGAQSLLIAAGLTHDSAKSLTITGMLVVSYAVIELLGHFLHIGVHITHDAHCKMRACGK